MAEPARAAPVEPGWGRHHPRRRRDGGLARTNLHRHGDLRLGQAAEHTGRHRQGSRQDHRTAAGRAPSRGGEVHGHAGGRRVQGPHRGAACIQRSPTVPRHPPIHQDRVLVCQCHHPDEPGDQPRRPADHARPRVRAVQLRRHRIAGQNRLLRRHRLPPADAQRKPQGPPVR